jgi:DNA-binding transcriptional MerR regulator/methylmalonyl-CoA mutase cobalamin-binding subunit
MEDRSPRFRIGQLAARTGVDPERLRKWEARYRLLEPERSAGGFRLYSLDDEQRVRLMQRHLTRGYAAAEAADLARKGVVSPSPARLTPRLPARVVARSARLLRHALLEFDEGAAERALDDLFGAFTVEAVLRDALLPFLRDVGYAWEGGEASPAQEHFASTIVEARLLALTRGWGTGTGPRALLACPSGERHTFGLVAFGLVLARRGWRITYLGADTPASSLAHAAAKTASAVTVLAASRTQWLAREAEELAALGARTNLFIGGAGATGALTARLRAEHLVDDPVTAATELALRQRSRPD